jgi:O-antigen ligase
MIKYSKSSIAVLSLGVWFVLMLAPVWFATSWEGYQSLLANVPVHYQAFGICLFCAAALSIRSRGRESTPKLRIRAELSHIFFFVFCAYTFLLSPLSISPATSFMFSIMHAVLFLACLSFWQSPASITRLLPILGLIIFAYLLLLAMALGTHGRTIGFFPPNDLAKLAMIGGTLCMFGGRKTALFGIAAALLCILLTQSRGTLIAFLLELTILWCLTGQIRGKLQAVLLLIGLLGLLTVVDLMRLQQPTIAAQVLDRVLLLSDEKRGTSSGLTGRTDHWETGLETWKESPAVGYGLRTRAGNLDLFAGPSVNAHSGYLNMMLDVGLIGAILVLTGFATNLYSRLRSLRTQANAGVGGRINMICLSFLVSALFLWFLEPIYINIGAPFSVMILLLLAAPIAAASEPAILDPKRRAPEALHISSG